MESKRHLIVEWGPLAACQNGDPDALFVRGAEQNVAKRICRSCPVRYECLADALDNRIQFGVWGGMTERERRALLRRHPDVASWRKAFEAGMSAESKKERRASQGSSTAKAAGAVAVEGAATTAVEPEAASVSERAVVPQQRTGEEPVAVTQGAEIPEHAAVQPLVEDQPVSIR